MSSITFADNKLGGRLMAAADALASGKLRTAAGIFNEVANELNVEAEATDGLLAPDDNKPEGVGFLAAEQPAEPTLQVKGQPVDLQMCARNVHAYSQPDQNGWRTCTVCGNVNVAPPDNNGPIDMGARQ